MKARVKATGNIINVELYYITPRIKTYIDGTQYYNGDELDFNVEYDDPNYWTRLKHQYTGIAMNALLLTNNIRNGDLEGMRECNTNAMAIAHALVEKLKEKKE